MSEENRQQQSSAESTVAGAANSGKASASIALGAATGGFDYCHAALGDIRIPAWRWH